MLLVVSCLIVGIHSFAAIRLAHLRYLLRYPPLPVSVLLGIPVLGLFISHNRWQTIGALEAFYLILWIGHASVNALATRVVSSLLRRADPTKPADKEGKSEYNLLAWIDRDYPVDDPSADLFNHTIIAERLVRRLADRDTTIALQGNFGSGKSSIGRIAESLSETTGRKLIFAYVSSWGFGESLDAQEELLASVLRRVSRHVDTSTVRSLPAEYVGSISSGAGWYGAVLRLITGMRSPQRVLKRMAPILSAIGKRVVLFIEDADRNLPSFDMAQVEALLMRLRDVPGLSFVLCISPTQKLDLPKLCDRTELVPVLDQLAALRLIHRTRELLLRKYPVRVMLDPLSALVDENEDPMPLEGYLGYFWPRQYTLPSLANSPRIMKRALRRVVDAWPELCGEVNIDDLIDISVLREAAPEAFDFFQRNYRLFRPAAKEHRDIIDAAKTKLKESLVESWTEICASATFDTRSAAWLMKDLFPASAEITQLMSTFSVRRQSIQSERRGDVYARRLLTETTFGEEISDQRLFVLLRNGQTEDTALAELAEAITSSKFASTAFEEFAQALQFDRFLPLLSQVYQVIRTRYGNRLSRDENPGFFAPWRLVQHKRPANFEDWLVRELQNCVPNNLRLLTEIYYFWLGADRHDFAEREGSRKAIYEALKKDWTKMAPVDIPRGFDPSFPYTLFHLFFTSDYQRPETVPINKIEDWSWSGGPIAASALLAPSTMLPQIIFVVNSASNSGREIPQFSLNYEMLHSWFHEHSDSVISLIRDGFEIHPELDARERYLLNRAVEAVGGTRFEPGV
jgi:hypothetical protein